MPAPACWTCRLRRKKCDRTRPACRGCAHLSIDCHYSSERPHWMDGGHKQKQRARFVKAQVIQGATSRRGKGFAVQVQPLQQEEAPSEGFPSSLGKHGGTTTSARAAHPTSQKETDDFLTSLYLDTVFPHLFPLYRPATSAGGRAWLLKAILGQPAIYHTVISISTYYFTLLLARDASQTLRTPCEQQVWDTLALHMDCSLKIIQGEMTAFNKGTWGKEEALKRARLLGAIVQQLIFYTAMAQGAAWKLHLTAALSLLREIIETHRGDDGFFDLDEFLQTMAPKRSIFDGLSLALTPWSEEQNAFRFFTAFLVYADVISGVMSGTPPKLQPYLGMLLNDGVTALKMEEFIGCPGWILAALGQISAIEASQIARGRSAIHKRGEEDRGKLAELKIQLQVGLTNTKVDLQTDLAAHQAAQAWIHGATLYLRIVEQGRRPSHTETKDHVQFITSLIGSPASQVSLRSIMWPVFMAGLLAGQEDEIIFTEAVSDLGALKAFGSAKQALSLLERAWLARNDTPQDTAQDFWQLSDCFGGKDTHGVTKLTEPTETAVPYAAFKEAGFKVQFATEAGKTPQCDKRMMEGVTGKLLGAKAAVVEQCKSMLESDEARHPLSWTAPGFSLDEYNLVLFPGGHDKAVRQIIDSKEVHKLILDYFPKTKKPSNKAVGAICHGVMVLSSAKGGDGKSVIHECTTTTLPGFFESFVYWATRAFLGDYYKTYGAGSENTEDSIRHSLADDSKQFKGSNSFAPFVVKDEEYNYVSARWPGDADLFARTLIDLVRESQ
ncbi:C6 zink-finger PRO1A [Fusarium tjaetaba]|uniref:C6 zink-finger PRO1A n=1 Tax=Fusarium tjaetaba TaxID=1567544 RepID=A0A8H5W768_9HYPO|nr:C6 zink-finger PRO1A [Fusarium tjaetaba]KAF5647855.1 C6 zink-finger PRO1A [Fusarium tjaetaba]